MRLFENAAFCVAIDVEMEISNDIPRSNYQIEDNLNPFCVLEAERNKPGAGDRIHLMEINPRDWENTLDNAGQAIKMRGNEGSSNINTTIYQSKLHKKLAFLEVKVKKSSDIKKTKDMLELNNQDSSHVIVYNIHRKITSIEKSLSHVVGVSQVSEGHVSVESNKAESRKGSGQNVTGGIVFKGQIFAPSFIYDISPNTLRDCWVVRAPGVDGNSGRYVVAASTGNTLESGFFS
ncbi:hypothetical protein F2Q69_00015652 [Brassica cretica]|uniref:Uncharacterized protein n=1 Tax=Brassica cretica TaxID=69181 RepID=A0A8S9R7Y1_BRACR|nr:hypothetical protein F2Q69_00015652 [Brassica cretica]